MGASYLSLIHYQRYSAAFVLADEAPHHHQAPIAPEDPIASTPSEASSAPISSAPQYILEPTAPNRNLLQGEARRRASENRARIVHTGETAGAGFTPNNRRRRRSPSTDVEESGPPSGISETGSEGRHHFRLPRGNQSLPAPGEVPKVPSPKRRRLMNKAAMRLDPDSKSSKRSQSHANGSSPVQSNGTSTSANGHSSPTNGAISPTRKGFSNFSSKRSGNFFGHDREEVTRLLIQGLGDLGYQSAANLLTQESGFEVESPAVAAFRDAILQGQWLEAETLLFGVRSGPDGGGVSISNGDWSNFGGLELAEGADLDAMRFSIREQKYLELLENQDTGKAMMVLRHELQPLHHDRGRLNGLSRSVAFPNPWTFLAEGNLLISVRTVTLYVLL